MVLRVTIMVLENKGSGVRACFFTNASNDCGVENNDYGVGA
jgi:hypothetical protein